MNDAKSTRAAKARERKQTISQQRNQKETRRAFENANFADFMVAYKVKGR